MLLENLNSEETICAPVQVELEDYSEGPHNSTFPLQPHHTRQLEQGDHLMSPVSEVDVDDICCVAVIPAHTVDGKYRRRYFIPNHYEGAIPTIKALQTEYLRRDPPPKAYPAGEFVWKSYTSPEGNLYFREESKNILTFSDLHNEDYLDSVSRCALHLLGRISKCQNLPEDCEVVIMLEDYGDGGGYGHGYYLASWEKRCVFWLDDLEYDFAVMEARVCISESHIGKHITYLFWLHVEMFPSHYDTPQDAVDDLKSTLNYGIYDHTASDNSIFPYTATEATTMLGCISRINTSTRDARDVWILARGARNIAEYEFLNFHGERGARIHSLDSTMKASFRGGRSFLFVVVSPLFFYLPNTYLEKIEEVWIDETVNWIAAKRLLRLFEESWQDSIVPATVILSTNVGFLAIQSIDTNRGNKSAAQIAAYISSVFAFFNIITTQILRIKGNPSHLDITDISAILERIVHGWLGLERIALMFSLPTTLMIWSMISFLIALMVVFFSETNTTTRIIMASVVIFLGSITSLAMWGHPIKKHSPDIRSLLKDRLQTLKDRLSMKRFPKRMLRRRRIAPRTPPSQADTASAGNHSIIEMGGTSMSRESE